MKFEASGEVFLSFWRTLIILGVAVLFAEVFSIRGNLTTWSIAAKMTPGKGGQLFLVLFEGATVEGLGYL